MTNTGTRDFLNGLRVAGRLWGSHGDKITNVVQGRNYDDDRATQKLGRAAAVAATGAGGEEMRLGAGSPTIMHQQSRDLVVSPSSPFSMRQASPTSGWGNDGSSSSASAASGSIMRQSSSDFVSSTATVVNATPFIARQASRDMPLPEILRQHSRELASISPTPSGNKSNASNNSNNNGFHPIGSPVSGGLNRDLSSSPVSFLPPPLLPGTIATPTALRPSGLRSPLLRSQSSYERGKNNRGAGGKQEHQRHAQSPSSPLHRQGMQEIDQMVPSLPPQILGQASKVLTERDERAHGAEHVAAKAVHEVKKDEEKEGGPTVTFSATEKVELVHASQASRRKSQTFGSNIFNRKNPGKSIVSRRSINAEPESVGGGGGGGGGVGEGGAVGEDDGGGWRPGHFLSRIMKNKNGERGQA